MKDAAYSVAVNGYNRTDRGPFHATQRWFSRASPKGIRATNRTAPCKQGGVRRQLYDDATSRWTDCIQSVGSYFLDRLDISFCLCPLSFLIVRSCLARTVVSRLPRNSCKGVQRYHYPSLVRPDWRIRISEIRSRQSAPRVIPNLAKPSKSFLSEESVTLKN